MTNTHPAISGLERRPESVYLGLGSNLGNRESKIREAIERIKALGLEITKASSIYETEPVGYANQPWFLNQVIEVRVDLELTSISEAWSRALFMREEQDDGEMAAGLFALSDKEPGIATMFWALGFLKALLGIEREMGRERTIPNGPRAIDIDILLCGEMEGDFAETRDDPARPGIARVASPGLSLPHPRMHLRRFVLEPLCEIAPDLMHPMLKKTCRELLASLKDPAVVRLYKKS
jgi:2-amino-4-hydroxy-6-hydroxymethyldihydropteridine diphosphokinase